MTHRQLDAAINQRTADRNNPKRQVTDRVVQRKLCTVAVCNQWYEVGHGEALSDPPQSKRVVVSSDATDCPVLHGIECSVYEATSGAYIMVLHLPLSDVTVFYTLRPIGNECVVADE